MNISLEAIVNGWWNFVSASTWQVIALILLVWLVETVFRNKLWPQIRYALWILVFIKLIIPPVFALPTGVFPMVGELISPAVEQVLPVQKEAANVSNPADVSETESDSVGSTVPVETDTGSIPAGAVQEAVNHSGTSLVITILFSVWALGCLVMAGILLSSTLTLRRWHDDQLKNPEIPQWLADMLLEIAEKLDIQNMPPIVFSEKIFTPAVYGFFRPILLLPADYKDKLDRTDMYYMVYHELAHISRRDLLIHGAVMLIQIVNWFNPFVHLAQRQLRHSREICCDLTVAQSVKERKTEYRSTLVGAFRRLITTSISPTIGLLGVFEEPYRVVDRIHWLEKDMKTTRIVLMLASLFLVAFFIAFIFPMSPSGTAFVHHNGVDTGGGSVVELDTGADLENTFLYEKSETVYQHVLNGEVRREEHAAWDELYLNDNVIVVIEREARWIFRLKEKTLTFINDKSRTWLETSVPVDLAIVYDDEARRRLLNRDVQGTVTESGNVKEVLGRQCKEFVLVRWLERAGYKVNSRKLLVYANADIPFKLDAFEGYLDTRRTLQGGSGKARQDMFKIKGIQLMIDFNPEVTVDGTKMVTRAVLIDIREAPEDLFAIPDSYEKVAKFKLDDI